MKFKISQLLHYILYKENTSLETCQSLYLMQILGTKCLVSKKPLSPISFITDLCSLSSLFPTVQEDGNSDQEVES